MNIKRIFFFALALIGLAFSAYASTQAFTLSRSHLIGPPVCPVLLGIPACVIVLVSYVLITIAWGMALVEKKSDRAFNFFVFGFLPAFILALIGSAGEIFGVGKCPHTSAGTPKCYISFGFLIMLAIGWGALDFLKNRIKKAH